MFAQLQGSRKCLNIWRILSVFADDDMDVKLTVDSFINA